MNGFLIDSFERLTKPRNKYLLLVYRQFILDRKQAGKQLIIIWYNAQDKSKPIKYNVGHCSNVNRESNNLLQNAEKLKRASK